MIDVFPPAWLTWVDSLRCGERQFFFLNVKPTEICQQILPKAGGLVTSTYYSSPLFLALCFSTTMKQVWKFRALKFGRRVMVTFWSVYRENILFDYYPPLSKNGQACELPQAWTIQAESGAREGACVWSRVQGEVMGHQAWYHGMLGSFLPSPKLSPLLLLCPLGIILHVGCIFFSFGLQDLDALVTTLTHP